MAQKKYVSIEKLGLYHEKEVVRVNGLISTAKDEAIAHANSLASNYDAAGAAATVQGKLDEEVIRAKAREDEIAGLVTKAQGDVDALTGKVGEVVEGSTVVGMIGAVDAKAIQNATDIEALEGKVDTLEKSGYDDTEVRGLITGLEANKADKTQVATDIETAVNAEKSARETAVAGVQGAVDALSGTHATDKKTLEDAIALKADITSLNAVSDVANAAVKQADYDLKVKALEDKDAEIVGLVEAEATKAREEEGKLSGRLDKVEAFFEGASEDSEGLNDALDTLVEIQTYVNTHGEVADQMVKDIAANKKAIEDHAKVNHDFASADNAVKEELNAEIAKKADKTTVEGIDGRLGTAEGKITTLEGKVSTLEGEMDAVEGAVATKAEQSALEAAVEALEGADSAMDGRIAALEGKFGGAEGSIEDMIADAEQSAKDAAAADATQKANTAEANAKGHADGLNTAMNARVEALEAIDHSHANKEELDLIASGDKAKWDVAAGKAHEHANKTVLDGITAEKVSAWDAAEGNAKSYADAEFVKDRARLDAVEAWQTNMIECSEEDINKMFVTA